MNMSSFSLPVVLPGCPHSPRGCVLIAGINHPPQKKKTLSEGAEERVVGEEAEGSKRVVPNPLLRKEKLIENKAPVIIYFLSLSLSGYLSLPSSSR